MDELVKALRETDFGETCILCEHEDMCKGNDCIIIQAADAIEELSKKYLESEVDNTNLTGWLAEEHAKHLWIPVTERLPLLNTPVLATDGIEVDISWMYGVPPRWITSFTAINEDKLTHWMPLPQTPKEEI